MKVKDEDGKESCELWPDGNAAAAQPAALPTAPPATVTAIHADGQQASLTNGDVIEWRRPNGPEMRLTAPLNPGVRALQFSPDGRRLFVLTRQHRMFSWDFDELTAALDERGL